MHRSSDDSEQGPNGVRLLTILIDLFVSGNKVHLRCKDRKALFRVCRLRSKGRYIGIPYAAEFLQQEFRLCIACSSRSARSHISDIAISTYTVQTQCLSNS